MRRFYLIFFLVITINLSAIGEIIDHSAYNQALAGLALPYQHCSNTRSHPSLQLSAIESSYTKIYSLDQLPFYNFHISTVFHKLGISLGTSYLDNLLYTELDANLGFSLKLNHLSLGTSISYLRTETTNYQNITAHPINISIYWQESNYSTVVTYSNIFATEYDNLRLPQILVWESAFNITTQANICLGFEKENEYDFSYKLGTSYQIFSNFSILSSYQFAPNQIGLGAVFGIKHFEVCYSIKTHKHLNLSQYITLHYAFKN